MKSLKELGDIAIKIDVEHLKGLTISERAVIIKFMDIANQCAATFAGVKKP